MDCPSMYTTVHCFTTWHYLFFLLCHTLPTQACCAHTMLGSVVLLYYSPVFVHLCSWTWRILTNESPTNITRLLRINQSQLWFLSIPQRYYFFFSFPFFLRHKNRAPPPLAPGGPFLVFFPLCAWEAPRIRGAFTSTAQLLLNELN